MAEKKPKKTDGQSAKDRLTKDRTVPPPDFKHGLSSGSALINMACTGRPSVAYVPGTYYLFIGDTNSGKTFCSLVAMAEAAKNPAYDGYRFVFDQPERGAQMNLVRHFGRKMADRIEPPCHYQGMPWYSERIEDFYLNLHAALDRGPCIYVLDSMDALSSDEEEREFLKMKKAAKKSQEGSDEKTAGSFGDGKAKKNSRLMRQVLPKLTKTGSILIVIDQTRDNVGTFSFEKKTNSGGWALKFYAQVVMWSSVRQKEMSKEIAGKKRHIGNKCDVHVKRSRYTGHEAKVTVPIYYSSGIDDVGSCIDYLIEEEHWKAEKGYVTAPEFGKEPIKRDKLIALVEEENKEGELHSLVAQVWCEIEAATAVPRKRKYE